MTGENFTMNTHYPLDTVEKYNLVTNSWTEVASLLQKRSELVAGVCNGKIYVFGGVPNIRRRITILNVDYNFAKFFTII